MNIYFRDNNTVTILFNGCMDSCVHERLNYAALARRGKSHTRYVFDWSKTTDLQESGVATLRSFLDWISDEETSLEWINCSPDILKSLAQLNNHPKMAESRLTSEI